MVMISPQMHMYTLREELDLFSQSTAQQSLRQDVCYFDEYFLTCYCEKTLVSHPQSYGSFKDCAIRTQGKTGLYLTELRQREMGSR